jgi:predicted Zn-dependent peptidase
MRIPRRGRKGAWTRETVDEMAVYWKEAPGPFAASLLFRVGAADEKLPARGMSHLVEHLAFFPIGQVSYTANGFIQELWSVFYAVGEQAEVLGFLTSLCRNLSELPLDRLEAEKRILTTEGASRSPGWRERLLELRFGPRGFGLAAHEEYGLRTATAEDVESWSNERFVKGNAALWMTSRPPDKFDLALRPGERSPVPRPERRPRLELPSHLAAWSGGVAIGAVAERSSALSAGFGVVVQRAEDRLRRNLGLSYNVGGVYEPLGADTAHLALIADCLDESAASVQGELMAILEDMASNGPTDAELTDVRDERIRAAADPTSAAGWMDYAARDELIEADVLSPDEVIARAGALTPEEVAASIAACLPELIVLAPAGTGRPVKLNVHQEADPEPVTGTRVHADPTDKDIYFVTDERGITLNRAGERPATVLFSECAAALRFSDLRLSMWSLDGSWMEIGGRYVRDGAGLIRWVLDQLPPSIVVPMEDVQTTGSMLDLYVEKLAGQNRPREYTTLLDELHPGERLEDLFALKAFRRRGLLALTDRRILCLWRSKNGDQVSTEETLREDLRWARVEHMNQWLRRYYVVYTQAGKMLTFAGFTPRQRAFDFGEHLDALTRGDTASPTGSA